MLVCDKCKTTVQLKTNHMILSAFYFRPEGLVLTELDIVKPEKIEYSFFCTNCKEEIPITDMLCKCYLCSTYTPVDEALLLSNRGNYCPDCAEKIFPTEIKTAKTVLEALKKGIK